MIKKLRRCTKKEAIDANKKDNLIMIAQEVVLWYFQFWGQKAEKRIEILNRAVQSANIKAEFIQWKENGQLKAGWKGEEGLRGKKFREELDLIFPIGSFEAEVSAVKELILKYKKED